MPKNVTRRKAITAGAATAGVVLGSSYAKSEQKTGTINPNTSNPPFLSPWSPPPGLKKDLTTGNTPVRFACSAYRLSYSKDSDITAMVKRVRDMGYTSTGSGTGELKRNQWLDASESEIRELKTALSQYDVTFFDMHSICNNIHPDLEKRRKLHRWVIEQMEVADRVGCPQITVHVGSRAPNAVHPHPENWTKETWDIGIREMKKLVADSSGMKCVMAVEPDSLVQINNPWACRQLVDECGPRVQICLDPVNMTNLEYHYRKTEYIDACFDLLGEDIFSCHAKDIQLENKLQPSLVQVQPGTGTMDYEIYFARLSRMKWPRTLFLEHLSVDKYPALKKFLEDTAAKVGTKIYE